MPILSRLTRKSCTSRVAANCFNELINELILLFTHRISVCQGVYPQTLIKEWDAWAQRKQTENDRPDHFDREQLFCTFVLENAGTDLEHYVLKDMNQAKSVLLQVCLSLATAEKVPSSSTFSSPHPIA
jgi:hypothetical protein